MFLWFIYFLPKPCVLVLARIGVIFCSSQEGDGWEPGVNLYHFTSFSMNGNGEGLISELE